MPKSKHMDERLIEIAKETVSEKSWTANRRAVSTAYYAVFHALARTCTEELFGRSKDAKNLKEHDMVYRQLDHTSLKSAFNNTPMQENETIKRIGLLAKELQNERHKADYMPRRKLYPKKECEEWISKADEARDLINNLSPPDKKTLAIYLIFKNRAS